MGFGLCDDKLKRGKTTLDAIRASSDDICDEEATSVGRILDEAYLPVGEVCPLRGFGECIAQSVEG